MVYHERQARQLCALHVLNNLLQVIKESFSKHIKVSLIFSVVEET